jgi:sugar lactone lactonase YvrE
MRSVCKSVQVLNLVRAFGIVAALMGAALANAQTVVTVVGTGLIGSDGDGAVANKARLFGTNGLALDRFGNLYLADSLNHRIRKIGLDGLITTIAGTGTAGFSGDGGAANKATINYPVMLAFAGDGSLLFSDYGNHRVRRIASDGTISTVAGNGTEGFSGDGGAASAAQLNDPIGIAAAADGSIYIGDAQNHRIRKVSANGTISTFAGTGTAGFAGDGAAATAAQFNFPGALLLDGAGHLLVADYANNRVRKIDASGVVTTFAGNGTAGSGGDNAAATAAQLLAPFALALGTNGSVLIAEQLGNRVRRVASNGTITTAVGGGATAIDDALASATLLLSPSGLTSNEAGEIWIADRGSHRVRKLKSPLRTLTEYRLAAYDYFFYTSVDSDKIVLDGLSGWSRTGASLLVNAANDSGTKPIVRYYFDRVAVNQTRGNHFYTLNEGEVAALNAANPNNARVPGLPVNEGNVGYAFAPTASASGNTCAATQQSVYRAFRNSAVTPDNPAHRYTTDIALYNSLVAGGWNAEGVVFCSAIAP